MTITIIAMSQERYNLAREMPEMMTLKLSRPRDERANHFAVAFKTESGDEANDKLDGIVEAYIRRGNYTHLMIQVIDVMRGTVCGSSFTVDIDKVPPLDVTPC